MKRRTRESAERNALRATPGGEALLEELLSAPDRDRGFARRPVVSVREQEDPGFLSAVESRRVGGVKVSRRGTWHGEWAELAEEDGNDSIAARWHAARPILLPGAASAQELSEYDDRIAAAADLYRALQEPRGLRAWLAELEPEFTVRPGHPRLYDEERDLERVLVASRGGRKVDDLWVKSSWLSTAENDGSLRVRVAFGRERDDDASGDLLRHRLVADLASRLFPESALVTANPAIAQPVELLISAPALFTQHIAYWNAPEGGALFHHDAFAEDEEESGRPGQLGVVYLQISGRTAWLALSIEDLAARVREFVEVLTEGELPWVKAQLFPQEASLRRVEALVRGGPALANELARPGCGILAGLVNRGPEFTAWLADAGHAAILGPGDAILLPNHGIARTAMHSVFCAGDEVAYALSLAIRADREEPSFAPRRSRR